MGSEGKLTKEVLESEGWWTRAVPCFAREVVKQSSNTGSYNYTRVYERAETGSVLTCAVPDLLRITQHFLPLPGRVPQPRHRVMFFVSCGGT